MRFFTGIIRFVSKSRVKIFRTERKREREREREISLTSKGSNGGGRPVPEEVSSRSVKIGKVLAWGQFIVEEAILDAKLPEIGLHGHGHGTSEIDSHSLPLLLWLGPPYEILNAFNFSARLRLFPVDRPFYSPRR